MLFDFFRNAFFELNIFMQKFYHSFGSGCKSLLWVLKKNQFIRHKGTSPEIEQALCGHRSFQKSQDPCCFKSSRKMSKFFEWKWSRYDVGTSRRSSAPKFFDILAEIQN